MQRHPDLHDKTIWEVFEAEGEAVHVHHSPGKAGGLGIGERPS